MYFVPSNCPKCLGGGLILCQMIVQHLAQPLLEEVEGKSLGNVVLHITALALLRQELAGNLVPSLLLQVVGACGPVLPSFLASLSRGVNRGVQRALHQLGKSCKW